MDVLELLKFEEGYRAKPYLCSENYPTVGIGKRIGPRNADLSLYQFEVPECVAIEWLKSEVFELTLELSKRDWFNQITGDRRSIIISMAYQMGLSGLFKFKKMIKAIIEEDWNEAAFEARDSLWYKQTKLRAVRHCRVLEGESIRGVYGCKGG